MPWLEILLRYGEFRILLRCAAIFSFVMIAWLLLIMLIHTAAALGQRTIMYGKQSPSAEWSKHFYPAALLLLAVLIMLTLWLRHIADL